MRELPEHVPTYEGRHQLTRANRRSHIRWKIARRMKARRKLDQVHHHATPRVI